MENFIVSARKYRPAAFETVVGQKSITTTLKNAIKNNKLAQAFLFCGPRGVGKTSCARILAKTINCKNITENFEACNECESCISFNNSATFNIFELDAASNNSVDDIRNLVDQVRIPPQDGKYKVYIIDEVHMLSTAAFNAFLKTLEEPPSYAKFILATTEKHKIIPTILSRCQIYDFKRIGIDDIAKHLAFVAGCEQVTADENALHIIAQKADGALRDALSMFDQLVSFAGKTLTYESVIENLNVLDYDYYFKIIDFIRKNDISSTLLMINEIIENGFDGQHFIIGFGKHLRSLLVCKDPATYKLLEVSANLKEKYQQQSSVCPASFLLKALDINNNYDINYKSSNNKRLHLEIALMQICMITSNLSTAEKKNSDIVAPKKSDKEPSEAQSPHVTKKVDPLKASIKPIESKAKRDFSGNIPGTISILQVTETNNGNDEKNKVQEGEIDSYQSGPKSDFSQNQLEEVWARFIKVHTNNMPSFTSALNKYKPKKKNETIIEFQIDNKIVANDKEKANILLDFLKEELQNISITLEPVVIENDKSKVAYTDKEKYDKMVKKNPSLQKLKDQLSLEIDF